MAPSRVKQSGPQHSKSNASLEWAFVASLALSCFAACRTSAASDSGAPMMLEAANNQSAVGGRVLMNENGHIMGYVIGERPAGLEAAKQGNALLDALLESVYASVARSNGLSLQGACSINGSLYVEGSAVVPEGNAYCQYCYCIRQKIMCVRPKCHLMISGCTPKYSNEHACCPTSYSCSASGANSETLSTGGQSSERVAAIGAEQQSLSAKLSAALESALSRLPASQSNNQAANSSSSSAEHQHQQQHQQQQLQRTQELVTARQVDHRSLGQTGDNSLSAAAMLSSLIKSLSLAQQQHQAADLSRLPVANSTMPTTSTSTSTSTAASPTTSTTTSSTTTTSTTTTTPPPPTTTSSTTTTSTTTTSSTTTSTTTRAPTTLAATSSSAAPRLTDRTAEAKEREEEAAEEEEEEEETDKDKDKEKPKEKEREKERDSDKERKPAAAKKKKPAAGESERALANAGQPTAAFLEPMNKLGPLIMWPAPSCTENGRQYQIGEQIPTLESCKHCYCGLDGMKECKMVECSLKNAHNCRPVTPAGHCCPIRYECPSNAAAFGARDALSGRNRSYAEALNSSTKGFDSYAFKDVSQCKSDLGEDCNGASNSSSIPTLPAPPPTSHSIFTDPSGTLDNIQGLYNGANLEEQPSPPILKTTRVIDSADNDSFNNNNHHTLNLRNTNLSAETDSNISPAPLSLTDELHKFIMQINQNATQGTGYSLLPSDAVSASANETGAAVGGGVSNTQEMMINNQHSRMVDYHSVQAPGSQQQQQQQPSQPSQPAQLEQQDAAPSPPMPPGVVGIPSIEPEPIRNLVGPRSWALLSNGKLIPWTAEEAPEPQQPPGGRALESSVEYLSNGSMSNGPASGQRDSRAAGAALANEQILAEPRVNTHASFFDFINSNSNSSNNNDNATAEPCDQTTPPEAVNISDDYMDEPNLNNSQRQPRFNSSEVPHVRLMRNNHNSPAPQLVSPTPPYVSPVIFDDALANNNNNTSANLTNRPAEYLTPAANYTSFGQESPRANSYPVEPAEENSSTPSPPQPTTGTPIGLDADRAPETRGWLSSLTGLVRNFGRRLTYGSANSPGYRGQPTRTGFELDNAASGEGDAEEKLVEVPTNSVVTRIFPAARSLDLSDGNNNNNNNNNAGQEEVGAGTIRVSECNVYGRIYKVGHFIEELSDKCKKCTCSAAGVDCRNICP